MGVAKGFARVFGDKPRFSVLAHDGPHSKPAVLAGFNKL